MKIFLSSILSLLLWSIVALLWLFFLILLYGYFNSSILKSNLKMLDDQSQLKIPNKKNWNVSRFPKHTSFIINYY